jgi:SPP1 family predicted phage head-tail adaptor
MTAGKLRTVVEFQRATKVSDGSGGYNETWAAISDSPTKAFAKALSGSERFASDRVEATTRWRIVVRYFSGLLESDIVVINSREYNIRFINNVEMADKWLEIDLNGGVAV